MSPFDFDEEMDGLESRMGELKSAFGLQGQELTLDLGPLRDLVSDCA